MRLHFIALPHTEVSQAFVGCAYTSKALKFSKMMGPKHEVLMYAPEGPEIKGATLIPCLPKAKRLEIFGPDDPKRLPDWPTDSQSALFNLNVVEALQGRVNEGDLVLLSGGRTHLPITQACPDFQYCEPGVGYEGVLAPTVPSIFAAYESYAWMSYVYGKFGITDIRYYDTVIPPYYDADDFPTLNTRQNKYLMFLGRRISRKGLQTAAEIAKRAGIPLFVAGAGTMKATGTDIHYVGPVNAEQRNQLLINATALLVPTTYLEPGGNVAIEAMACGTPVIATDFGVFTETVQDNLSGYRFRLLRDAVKAVKAAANMKPEKIRDYALSRYSLDAVGPKFDKWFNDLQTLGGLGWYAP